MDSDIIFASVDALDREPVNELGIALAADPGNPGSDRYTVDPATGTGPRNRWHTQVGGGAVDYGDRAAAEAALLGYTGAPLPAALEITGTPLVTVHLACETPDLSLFLYLSAVHPDGSVSYLTEGQLRLAHRRAEPDADGRPRRGFTRAELTDMEPGVVEPVVVELLPLSVLLRAGDRLRLSLAGADAGTFARIPSGGRPEITVHHGVRHPSSGLLPVWAR